MLERRRKRRRRRKKIRDLCTRLKIYQLNLDYKSIDFGGILTKAIENIFVHMTSSFSVNNYSTHLFIDVLMKKPVTFLIDVYIVIAMEIYGLDMLARSTR